MKYCSSPRGNSFSLQITSKEMCTWREKPRNDLNVCRSWGARSSPNKTTSTLVQCLHNSCQLKQSCAVAQQTFPYKLWLHQIWNILDGFWLRRFFSVPFLGHCLVIIGTVDLFGLSHLMSKLGLICLCFLFLFLFF